MLPVTKCLILITVTFLVSNVGFTQENESKKPILCTEIDSVFTGECLVIPYSIFICTDMYFEGDYLGRKSYYDSALVNVRTIECFPNSNKWTSLYYSQDQKLIRKSRYAQNRKRQRYIEKRNIWWIFWTRTSYRTQINRTAYPKNND